MSFLPPRILRLLRISPAVLLPALAAHAQSSVDPTHKFAWSENCGWTNWRDAGDPVAGQGARIGDSFLGGFVWNENAGWINLGDGSPINGSDYENLSDADFGVNFGPDLFLEGLAWGENIGWIKFGPFPSLPGAQRASYDIAARRFRGYAWGENIGWLNLDDVDQFVGIACPGDFNLDGNADFFDYLDFVDAFSQGESRADINRDLSVDFFDYLDFVDAFSAGC